MDIKILETIGLTKGEAQLYITLLKTGNTTSGKLINESGVSRSKVYDVLERLKQKGLVTEIIKENVRYFEATDPSRIKDYLSLKKKEIDDQIKESQGLIKDLKKLQNSHLEKQEARVYTGIEGLKTVYNEILQELNKNEEYLAFGIGEREMEKEEIRLFIKKFHLRRAERKIPARIVMNHKAKKQMKEFSNIGKYSYRFTDINFPTNIAIFKDKVLTLVWDKKPIAFLIKSKEVAKKYKFYFEGVWEQAKK